MNKSFYILASVVVLAGIGWWFTRAVKERLPTSPDQSVEYPVLGREHISEDAVHPPYNSNPPSSGWHYGAPARLGFYGPDEPLIPDETLVHNLEHGEIWIAYRPTLPAAVIDRLKKFAGDAMIIVTPRPANDADIALVAWSRVDKWDLPDGNVLDEARIKDFINRWRNRGPERVAPTVHQRR